MATESEDAAGTARSRAKQTKAEPSQQDAPDTPVVEMPVSQLIEGATGYLGVASWEAAGAFHGRDPDEMMTVDAAKTQVENWLETPIENGEEE